MGCDIHLYFEEKTHLGKWVRVDVQPENIIPRERCYTLFAFLFDVRNHESSPFKKHIFAHRGIPEDSAWKDAVESVCYHSNTYIMANEASQIEWPESLKDCYFRIFLEHVFPRIQKGWYNKSENIRMLVSFDN